MAGENRPLSEIFREAADEWVDLDAAARLREETKSLRFAQKCMALGDGLAVNKSEQMIKASKDWHEEVLADVESRTKANKAKVYMESIKMRFSEWQSQEANARLEAKL